MRQIVLFHGMLHSERPHAADCNMPQMHAVRGIHVVNSKNGKRNTVETQRCNRTKRHMALRGNISIYRLLTIFCYLHFERRV